MSEASQGPRDKFVVVGDIDSILSNVNYGENWIHVRNKCFEESIELQKRRTKGCRYESLFERCYEGILLGLVVAWLFLGIMLSYHVAETQCLRSMLITQHSCVIELMMLKMQPYVREVPKGT
jgi:hypothetical protein